MVNKMKNVTKKVCLVTSEESFLNNYGAALQGFALFQTIKKIGFEVSVLKYRGGMEKPFKDLTFFKKIRRILSKVYYRLFKNKHEKKLFRLNKEKILQRNAYFLRFYENNFAFLNNKRLGWYEVKKINIDADIFVCGSDQIWNPYFKNGENDLGYFLAFAPKEKLKISYAPSFGCFTLPLKSSSNISELLNSFDYISVREKEGQNIISKYTNLDSYVALDPTLLIEKEKWDTFARIPKKLPDKYIFVYRFANNKKMKEEINEISKKTKLPVVVLPLSSVSLEEDSDWINVFDVGPFEFIGTISKASLVCTDSFHATVFSLIYNIPFLVFERENFNKNGDSMNSRILNLLRIAELESQIFNDSYNLNNLFNIDFEKFNKNVLTLRNESICWLERALFDKDEKKQ